MRSSARWSRARTFPPPPSSSRPNWIVQYLVQNSVGRLWLMANPGSTLKGDWRYYIEPAEQTPEVQAQLDALIQNLDAVSKLWADVVANDLEEAFWSLVARETGYSDATPTLRDLLFRILVSDLSRTVSGSCPAQLSHFVLSDKALAANASVFASGWRSHMQHFGSYDALSGQVGRELGLGESDLKTKRVDPAHPCISAAMGVVMPAGLWGVAWASAARSGLAPSGGSVLES
jgi:hypothetical protein